MLTAEIVIVILALAVLVLFGLCCHTMLELRAVSEENIALLRRLQRRDLPEWEVTREEKPDADR